MTEKTPSPDNLGWQGPQDPTAAGNVFNSMAFLFKQLAAQNASAALVQVKSVTNVGGVAAVGSVSVQPMVNQVDGSGNATPHGTIFNIPYFRMQGGAFAVILDPKVGDIGIAVFCDRDISSVKVNKAVSNPGSARQFDWADGLYLGGFLNGVPTSYVQFDSNGKISVSPDSGVTSIALEAGKITLTADEIVSHARVKNVWDAGGTGFVYVPSQIDTYTVGVPTAAHSPTPPEVPT
jgi:hypothetical protein